MNIVKTKQMQNGRSMIEMLGVLAVVGVLSLIGLIGYMAAMNKIRANRIVADVMLLATEVQTSGRTTIPADFVTESGMDFSIETFDDGYEITALDVHPNVCAVLMKVTSDYIVSITATDGSTDCGATNTNVTFAFETPAE